MFVQEVDSPGYSQFLAQYLQRLQVGNVGGVMRSGRASDHQGGLGLAKPLLGMTGKSRRYAYGKLEVLAPGDAGRQQHQRVRRQQVEFFHQATSSRLQF